MSSVVNHIAVIAINIINMFLWYSYVCSLDFTCPKDIYSAMFVFLINLTAYASGYISSEGDNLKKIR